ncbi:MAG TPA: hypothetical protein VGQ42_06390 [Candidatus Dormibacteraeota bacterium]|jgi:hypothetical protein|nr:hypothetical protein [Candidatus Dormibacteraeota bacterium]
MSSLRVLLLPVFLLCAACGSSAPTGVATGPSQTAGPPTTPSATATATDVPATPSATATPSPTPRVSPTAQPTSGAIVVPPTDNEGALHTADYLYPSQSGSSCGARTGHYDDCPVTARLAARLDGHPLPGGEALCRCQNFWQGVQVQVTQTPDPTVWVDHVVITFGPSATVKIDVRVLRTAGGWVADDTSCTGQGAQTSIYAQNPPPCPG